MRIGSKQQSAANFCRALPAFMHFYKIPMKTGMSYVGCINLFTDPVVAVMSECDIVDSCGAASGNSNQRSIVLTQH